MGKNFIEDIAFAQNGSMYVATAATDTKPAPGTMFVAIQCLAATTFTANTGLISDDTQRGSSVVSIDSANVGLGTNGSVVPVTQSFSAGTVLYGRWKSINIASGAIIAYFGY